MEDKWLHWASQLQSIAQAGLTFGADQIKMCFEAKKCKGREGGLSALCG
jgi:hypothetical protein